MNADLEGYCKTTKGGCIDLRETRRDIESEFYPLINELKEGKVDKKTMEKLWEKLDSQGKMLWGILITLCCCILGFAANLLILLVRAK